MKLKQAICASLALAPAVALAQSVTLYGVIDTGIEYVNHADAGGHGLARMNNLSGTVPSRWGMRGTEDLGGGLKSAFVLESGFAPDSGVSNQAGRLFGRQAWVGLSGPWGQVALGRQYTMLFWATLDPDTLGPNTFGTSSLDSYMANPRTDNAISYKGTFGGLTLGATYSFGRDAAPAGTPCAGENAGDRNACREWSALIGYGTGDWGVFAAYDSLRGGAGAAGGLTSSARKDDRLSLSGFANVGRAKLGGGWIRRDNDGNPATPRSDLWYGGLSYAVTPAFSIDGEVLFLRYHDSANKAWLYAARANYAFSKRTSVYATAGFIDNGGQLALSVSSGATPAATPGAGGNQLGAMVGIKHIF
ncbi:porin [Cupriavidus sp. WS]|uniref:porin n=1 Tax=Cupriavidus sp. WS TaxID=1312922 RepID=UPI00036AFDA2|nr:porin [Cupriavidus sp. WS]